MKIKILAMPLLAASVILTFAFTRPVKRANMTDKKKHPNILIILVDQFRGQALGFEGKEPVITPNLDLLAKNSYVGLQMIANYPVCSPSRAMLMTGKCPLKNHVYGNVNSNTAPYGVELPASITC